MTLIQIAGVATAAIVGCGVLRANPKRDVNRGFFLLSVGVCAWLWTLTQLNPRNPDIVLWVRITNAVAAFLPWLFWLLKETIKGEGLRARTFLRSWPWLLIALIVVVLCFTEYFIPSGSTRERAQVGWGRTVYSFVMGVEYLLLLLQALMEMRKVDGIRRVELQFLMLGGTAAGFSGTVLTWLGATLDEPDIRRQTPLVIVLFYGVTAWAVTTKLIFDARQLFRVAFRRVVSIAAVMVIFGSAVTIGERYLSKFMLVAVSAFVVMAAFEALDRWKEARSGGDTNSVTTRRSLLSISRETLEWPRLESKLCEVLSGWGRCEHAYIFVSGEGGGGRRRAPMLPAAAEKELLKEGWGTPAKIQRETPSAAAGELESYMLQNRMGVMVAGPGGPSSVPVMVGLENRVDGRPYTYTDVQFIREWAAIVEGCVSRVVLTRQARDAEQLATAGLLGASLAHEIRNPMVTIKSVVHAAKDRYTEPDFRRLLLEVLPGEIDRIETLVTGLMDLGKPRDPKFESVKMNVMVLTSLKLVRPKAKEKDVVVREFLNADRDEISADQASLRQVVLNLVMNAIDAVGSTNNTTREVTLTSMAAEDGYVLEVSDSGPGVPAEARRTLFRPFTTSSKSSGMGLGLAICAEIVRAHHGAIELVERADTGATFRITLPWLQPSS